MLARYAKLFLLSPICFFIAAASFSQNISWPNGNKVAISLTFDDGRMSQVDTGTALLDEYDVKATFYVVPSAVRERLDGWKKAVASGHEIGNHSLFHPCTGNFPWARPNALETYTLEKMHKELKLANDSIQYLLNVKSTSFAYPCGQTFVGRGVNAKSYIPVVAKLFASGRGWLDEGPNDPAYCDFAQLTGMEMDGKNFDEVLALINQAKETGAWLVLAGHEMGEEGAQTTRLSMLRQLLEYAKDPANQVWIAAVNTVTAHIQQQKSTPVAKRPR